MTQYLSEIKALVENLGATSAHIDRKDIILYIVNGIPPNYQSFKTAIQTKLTPISLNDSDSPLYSEQINLLIEQSKLLFQNDSNIAPTSHSTHNFPSVTRSRAQSQNNKGGSPFLSGRGSYLTQAYIICQICKKKNIQL